MSEHRQMEMAMVFLSLNIFLFFSAFQVQESSGLNLPYSVPGILPFKDLKFYFKNQMNGSYASSPAPTSHPHHHPSKYPWKRKWHSIPPKMQESKFGGPSPQPMISPSSHPPKKHVKAPTPSPFLTLPPPPPNQDCSLVICAAPLTLGPPGSPCGCVWPIEVSLHLSTTLYTFFPLVSEFAKELSLGLKLNGSQVRIMGANAANLELQKTTVILNLVPQNDEFDASTAYAIYMKFWKREVFVRTSLFGMYQVLYVRYPGLPPSPPALSASASATISSEPYRGGIDSEGMTIKPLGVDVPKSKKNGLKGTIIMVIVLSSITTSVVCIAFIWLLVSKFSCAIRKHEEPSLAPSEPPRSTRHESLSHPSTASVSLSSTILPYTGTAKIFTIAEMERATGRFQPSNVIGEGGFGIVYRGILDDGSVVAVKVLKRDDRQGTREFLAEVEMLNRLHHRNLVKLIGICTDAQCRCLVYELVPNGSVESHLQGVDREAAPLDWCSRVKIALGAARGLAYLHEDSSPRVIHRDFKSSNILLEHDFTPKVSDFGLAKAAFEEQSKHVSTHVMGTFGYLAPEYAMTGHLLVKSDVYSYGVVLLELLTGRKPVDLSQPPGQENLVSWARPLLTSNEGLEAMLDPYLTSDISFDSAIKFAAIASMCVQPEVSHRPFMGEVVQALKLVCNEIEEMRMLASRTCSQKLEFSSRISSDHDDDDDCEDDEVFRASFDGKRALSTSQFGVESESFRRQFNSAPLKMARKRRFWERLRGLSRGSMSEHGFSMM